ncbi:MAG: pseudouridine synthase [Tunicatimonas sp.]|uniref:pseudouridine synthase n=1 Tax=Tunicatimonas sp. TaxID=1940096 RepID=UPI003C779301
MKKNYRKPTQRTEKAADQPNELMRLNRYIANAGVCSRREADKLIEGGQIKVNGKVVTELGTKVKRSDKVKYQGKVLNPEKLVYVLLNKPKDFITTTDDPQDRKTVMQLVANAAEERIYPVGRLDRNTTGLLLLTNDGELAERLTHPSYEIQKLYQVDINEPITDEDFIKIENGVVLEDGAAPVDEIGLVGPERTSLGISLHIGRNRIVRRIFEHLGYEVIRLDRVMYAGLTKKDLSRGKWRYLNKAELIKIKHLGRKK